MNSSYVKPAYDVLMAPFIKADIQVIQSGMTNGRPNIPPQKKYNIAPSAKKIATYMVNQIFGSELVTQTEGLNIGWLMPTLKEALEEGIYQEESFIYIHIYDEKVYLECFRKNDIHDLVQKFDKVISGTIVQEFPIGSGKDYRCLVLERNIKLDDGKTLLKFRAFEKDKSNKLIPMTIEAFNNLTDSEYDDNYILPYECLINVDLGQDFFADSRKFLNAEMKIVNTFAEEIEKTKTRVATSQHFQSGDLVTGWTPGSTQFKVETLSVKEMQDYFTLLPGDKEHYLFEFLQGAIRSKEYIESYKFYDYQIIQMAGLSPASFGYEKDAYMNTDNVELSKNNSDMTVEAIKTQITPQINKLLINIVKAQQALMIEENLIPAELNWDYGSNEKFEDMDKIKVLRSVQGVTAIPASYKAKVIVPIIKKLIDKDYEGKGNKDVDDFMKEYEKDIKSLQVEFGEV